MIFSGIAEIYKRGASGRRIRKAEEDMCMAAKAASRGNVPVELAKMIDRHREREEEGKKCIKIKLKIFFAGK